MAGISSRAANSLENSLQFVGKEKQHAEFIDGTGLEMYDFGARLFDQQIGRFIGIDAYTEKYHALSPFHYSANNPINAYDFDGNDFRLVIDHEKHTITIEASYYARHKDNKDEQSVISNIISFWNSQSGKYQYHVGEGENAISYTVNFNLTETSGVTYSENGTTTVSGGEMPANSVDVMSDRDFSEVQARLGTSDAEGVNWFNNIIVPKRRANDKDVASHEGGHNLGMTHKSGDVMNPGLDDVNRRTNANNVNEVLGRSGIGPNSENQASTSAFGRAINNVSNGTQPKGFTTGQVRAVPKEKKKRN